VIKSYKDLEVWVIGMELAKEIYKLSGGLPKEELYGITSQIRRAAVSIPSNIAEGQQRHYRKEFVQFLYQAMGSLAELETQLILVKELYTLDVNQGLCEKMDKLGKKLRNLLKTLASHEPQDTNH